MKGGHVTLWAGLRAFGLLRRIAKALEAGNLVARERLALDYPEWGKREGLLKPSKLVDLGVAKVEDWNEEWRKTHEGIEESK